MTIFPYEIIDLTHTLDENIPSWTGGCGFRHHVVQDFDDCTTDVKFRNQEINMQAGIGTHMDAPAHCISGGMTIDQLLLSDLIAPCVMIDVSQKAHEKYSVSVEDIISFEQEYGVIPAESFVMIRTGWERFWKDPEKYRNNLVFPSVSGDAAAFLMARDIKGLGIDTLSPDRPESGYPVHATVLGAGKYIVENASQLEKLPPQGSFILVLPIKIRGGAEAPVRLIGLKRML